MDIDFRLSKGKLLKTGKITRHWTVSNGKKYVRSKIYLHDASLIEKTYEMYNLGYIHLREWNKRLRGRGILVFIPDNPRPKEWIGKGAIL